MRRWIDDSASDVVVADWDEGVRFLGIKEASLREFTSDQIVHPQYSVSSFNSSDRIGHNCAKLKADH
jgi:hypothetical protein